VAASRQEAPRINHQLKDEEEEAACRDEEEDRLTERCWAQNQ